MYTADSKGVVKVWICVEAGWRLLHSFACHDVQGSPIMSLRCHPFAGRLLVHVRDSVVRSVDLQSYAVVQRYPGALNNRIRVRSCFSPCGSLVLSGSEDGYPRVWNTETGTLLKRLDCLGAPVHDVACHPRDNIVAVCSFAPNQPIVLLCSRPSVHRQTLAPLPPSRLLSTTLLNGSMAFPAPLLESTRLLQDTRLRPFEHNSSLTFDFMQAPGTARAVDTDPALAGTTRLPGTLAGPFSAAASDELHTAYEQHLAAMERRSAQGPHPFGIATPARPS